MGRLLALVLLAGLCGCGVTVTGAPCKSDDNCPGGQRCGVNLRCSVEALSCPASICHLGETACAADDTLVSCRADGVCGQFPSGAGTACTAGLVCVTHTGAAQCECPAYSGADLYVDPDKGSAPGAAPFPTGALLPESCRFQKLGDALAVAQGTGRVIATGAAAISEWQATHQYGVGDTVMPTRFNGHQYRCTSGGMSGGTEPQWPIGSGQTVSDGALTWNEVGAAGKLFAAESFPLVVPNGITMTTVDCLPSMDQCAPWRYAIKLSAASGNGIQLGSGTDFSGFSMLDPGATRLASAVASATGAATIVSVRLYGAAASPIGTGLLVNDAGGITAKDVVVAGFGGDGVRVAGLGDFALVNAVVALNQGIGVAIIPSASTPTVVMENNQIYSNGAAASASAGVAFLTPFILTSFKGNSVFGNAGPQIRVVAASSPWPLSGTDCSTGANTVSCYAAGSVGIDAPSGTATSASAANFYWQSATPTPGVDYNGTISTGVGCGKAPVICPPPP